jgi:hypothetical protein
MGLAVDVATLDSIRRPTNRRGQPTAPGSAARARISARALAHGGHRDGRIPRRTVMADSPQSAGDLT